MSVAELEIAIDAIEAGAQVVGLIVMGFLLSRILVVTHAILRKLERDQ